MTKHFFSYNLWNRGTIVRSGKGSVSRRSESAVQSYLQKRYGDRQWNRFDYEWHSSESAAFKRERQLIDKHQPIRNQIGGGGGGRVSARCKAIKLDGTQCKNGAVPGNYGFCRVHR